MSPKYIIRLVFSLLFLSSCGGGGSSSSDDNSSSPTPAPTPAPAPERYNIRGQVTLEQDVIIDTDVPNKAFSYLSNNLSSNAQPVFSPATIIGYAGTHTSEEGEVTRDALDVYVLSLDGENVQITLNQAISNADHDLFLYDSDQLSNPLEFSANISSQENINFSGSGIYYLVVTANQNRIGSKYSLSIEQGLQSYRATKSNTAENTGEFLVIQNNKLSSQITNQEITQINSIFNLKKPLDALNKSRLNESAFFEAFNESFELEIISREFYLSDLVSESIKKNKINQFLKNKFPNWLIDLNHIYYPDADPIPFSPDPFYEEYQWNLRQIKAEEALNIIGQDTKNIVVAVLDSGAPTSDSLAFQNSSFVEGGYDFVSDTDASFDGDGLDSDPTDPDFQPVQSDGEIFGSHGSHVATTMAAKNDGNEINGLAVQALPLRVCGSDRSERGGGCSSYDQLQAFYYIQGKENDSGVVYDSESHGNVNIINMSLGGGGNNQIICEEIENMKNNGIFVVASAGNEGNSAIRFPASCEYSFSVSSTKFDERRSSFSSFNNYVDIAAPGGQNSEDLDGNGSGDGVMAYSFKNSSYDGESYKGLQVYNGTSMAAPHVSAYFAILKYLEPDLSHDQLKQYLRSGNLTKDIGNPGKDDFYGYGLMDMAKGISNIQAGISGDMLNYSVTEPDRLFLGYALSEKNFQLSGLGSVSNIRIQDSTSSINIEAIEIDANGFGTYKVNLNRSSLADGNYVALAIFDFIGGQPSTSIPILFSSGEEKIKATVDQLWICAVNDENEIIPCDVMQMEEGVANFRIREVPNDTYDEVFACTTLGDVLSFNDQGICGPGDLRGDYTGGSFRVSGSDVNGINLVIAPVINN